jgi:hypothetical protein
MEEEQMSQVPIWVVASLGKKVALLKDFSYAGKTYPAGSVGLLQAIMITDDSPDCDPYAIVSIDPDDDTYMQNFEFSDIRPLTDKVKFSLNIKKGIIAF